MLKQVQMVGCQSWENCTFNLDPKKINVIIADNNTGKSVFFKMLKITACPKHFDADEQKDLIRKGFDKAQIIFFFEDGAIGSTAVFPNKVMYFYRLADEENFTAYLEPPEEMLQNIGLISDVKNNFIANVVDTDQDLLLVNHRLKSNADLMKLLVVCDDLESVRERSNEILDSVNADIKEVTMYRYQLENVLSKTTYVDIDKEKMTILILESVKQELFRLVDVAEGLQKAEDSRVLYKDFYKMRKILECIQSLEKINLVKVVTKEKPVDFIFLKVLLKLETIELSRLLIKQKPDYTIFRIVEKFESLDFNKCQIQSIDTVNRFKILDAIVMLEQIDLTSLFKRYARKQPPDIKLCHILSNLDKICAAMQKYQNAVQTMSESSRSSMLLNKQFIERGEILECPVHRRVLYDGKECIPYSI